MGLWAHGELGITGTSLENHIKQHENIRLPFFVDAVIIFYPILDGYVEGRGFGNRRTS
jgi:hypothetical protein